MTFNSENYRDLGNIVGTLSAVTGGDPDPLRDEKFKRLANMIDSGLEDSKEFLDQALAGYKEGYERWINA